MSKSAGVPSDTVAAPLSILVLGAPESKNSQQLNFSINDIKRILFAYF